MDAPTLHLEAAPPPGDEAEFSGLPSLRLGAAEARIEGERARLRDERSGARGELVLDEARGTLRVPDGEAPLDDLLTVATALLLARGGRALAHAGAVTDPDGEAWLVAGDTHAGKSTVCATLALGGWGFLSDDQAVLAPDDAAPVVEGWPRPLRLDAGWPDDGPTGRRRRRAATEAGLERLKGTHPLGGILLPSLEPPGPTGCERASPGEALTALVRQSPWLMADPGAASGVLRLLERAVSRPAWRLGLGREAFGDPEPILRALAEARA